MLICTALALLPTWHPLAQDDSPGIDLFDGESLNGWDIGEGEDSWWRVQDGLLTGGSLERKVPYNTFLCTEKSFQNFELTLEIRVVGTEGFINSGVQIRSRRVESNHEMSGYQVDAGDAWWGKLYDESRRNRVLSESARLQEIWDSIRDQDWNQYRILAEGPRIRSWINGIPALDYTETDLETPLDGQIGFQVHSGGKALVQVRSVRLKPLPDTPGAMTWRRFDKMRSLATQGSAPIQTAAEELAGFHLPAGFEMELVASEPSMNKVVDLGFDDAGKMWAITAVEYPIDGNESSEAAELYARGGRDKVLVFDEPWKPGPHTPRVFADGLAIPLAILPRAGRDGDSALIGMGPDILRLEDRDGDGRADEREVVLTGFGIQDSHLLPHRFVRAPGGWVYVAQGAFNSSQVQTTRGDVVPFNKCKVGRFQSDGSRFEVVSTGLNNVWGFVLDRLGDKWIQEANDLGYPLVPFEHGASYPGIGSHRARPHSPWRPALAKFRMGGTGLSGLALSEDRGEYPAPWDETFFLANPILSCIQTIRAERSGDEPSTVALTRTADMVISEDKNFRPIAIHFGPDGCLYVVDWYNPIISHNEVPRNHPDRDKTHSRIWRIRHASQEYSAPRDVVAVADADLPALLDAASTWESRAAWHQIADRQAQSLSPELERMAGDDTVRTAARVLALWCLEDLGRVRLGALEPLFRSAEPSLRREAARLCAALDPKGLDWEAVLGWARAEPDPRVRFAAIEALGSAEALDAGGVNLLLGMVRSEGEVEAGSLAASDRAFERSLVRVALEGQADALAALLDGDTAVAEPMRCLAALCMGDRDGAERLGQELTRAGRSPNTEEYGLISQHAESEVLRTTIRAWWSEPRTRLSGLRMVIDNAGRWDVDALRPALTVALRELVQSEPRAESRDLLLRGARTLRLGELEPDVIGLLDQGEHDALACLQALSELGSQEAGLFFEWAQASVPASQARTVAATALARISTDEAFELALELWPFLERATRREVLAALITQRAGALRTLAALGRGDLPGDALSERVLDRMQQHLGERAELDSLRADLSQRQAPVLTFGGAGADFLDSNLKISGPFTVEAWVRVPDPISNADGILCQPGLFDFNFAAAQPRLWCGPAIGDVIISKKKLQADVWTHVALTRDAEGVLCLYLQGELDQTSTLATQPEFEELDVARTTPGGGMNGDMAGFRLWSCARTAQQIADGLGLRMEADAHPDLMAVIPTRSTLSSLGAFGALISDAPPTLTAEEARAQSESFAHIRSLARAVGDPSRGKEIFAQHCLGCHRVAGEGADLGPVLDGAGAKGIEGLLRSIVTPNAGVESGYRTLVVETVEGELLEGFLAGEDATSIVLRRKDRADLKLPRGEILSMRFDSLSLMPEALLDPLEPEQITDLFSYLIGL